MGPPKGEFFFGFYREGSGGVGDVPGRCRQSETPSMTVGVSGELGLFSLPTLKQHNQTPPPQVPRSPLPIILVNFVISRSQSMSTSDLRHLDNIG